MTIKHLLMEDGGFVCGNTVTGVTVYSYPSSLHAKAAIRNAETAARSILAEQPKWRGYPEIVKDYDARNWARMGGR